MRSIQEYSNIDPTHSNCNPLQPITTKQNIKPNCSQQQPSPKDKHLHPKMDDTNKLYIKQFFQHFFEKKSMLQVLSQISNGIQVIQTLVLTFQNSKRINSNSKFALKNKINLNGDFPNIIERQGRQISECVQGLYQRLQNIFEEWGCRQQRQVDEIPKLFDSQGGDQQLYDMLNNLKQKYSRQKQIRQEVQYKWRDLQRNVIRLQDQKKRITQSYKSRESQVNQLNKKISQLQQKIQGLTDEVAQTQRQKEELSEKLTVLFQINQNLSHFEKDNQQLAAKLKKAEQNQMRIAKKFDSLQNIVKQKIQQRDDRWMLMIEQKLTSKTLFSNASCAGFRTFMSSIHTLNK